jgi:hypothetical protein
MHHDDLSDDELLRSLTTLTADARRILARVLVCLIEVDNRRLHLRLGCASLFDFCVRTLGLGEGSAYRRITAARLVRQYPQLLSAIEEGRIHLVTLDLLRPYLTPENVDDLVAASAHRTRRQVEALLAERFPRPDAPSLLRKLPERSPVAATVSLVGAAADPAPRATSIDTGAASAPPPVFTRGSPARERTLAPLSAGRYKLQVTIGRETQEKLELAHALLRHAEPTTGMERVVERAVDALLTRLEKQKLGRADRPRSSNEPTGKDAVSRSTRRAVFARDGVQCTFVGRAGDRCPARAFLELDHRIPRALGGDATSANLRVLCRNHNRLVAEEAFGRDLIDRMIDSRRRTPEHRPVPTHPST